MPYIDVNITKKLTDPEKDGLKATLGNLISIIPGKHEAVLMIGIDDGKTIYFAGKREPLAAFLEIKLFKEAAIEAKSEFTAKVFDFLERDYGIARENVFQTFSEHDSWGAKGQLKR